MAKIKVTQVRSSINRTKKQKQPLAAVGIRKLGMTVEHNNTPNIFPSRLGLPESIFIPIKAVINPIIFFIGTFSPNKKYAIKIPKGISACTKRVAEVPPIIFKPL